MHTQERKGYLAHHVHIFYSGCLVIGGHGNCRLHQLVTITKHQLPAQMHDKSNVEEFIEVMFTPDKEVKGETPKSTIKY